MVLIYVYKFACSCQSTFFAFLFRRIYMDFIYINWLLYLFFGFFNELSFYLTFKRFINNFHILFLDCGNIKINWLCFSSSSTFRFFWRTFKKEPSLSFGLRSYLKVYLLFFASFSLLGQCSWSFYLNFLFSKQWIIQKF